MLQKEQILSILKKYGYYSLNRAPYLYQEEQIEKLGIYFVWPHKHYGNLERVLFFETVEEVEEEVYKYWWFQTNKEKYNLYVEFDSYETLHPCVSYIYKGTTLTVDIIREFREDHPAFINPKETIKKRQLLRTASILILILQEKIKVQNEMYWKVVELSDTLKSLQSEYKSKLSLYKRGIKIEIENFALEKDDEDESEKLLKKLHEEMDALENMDEIRTFINTLFQYLVNLETSTSTIQNAYLYNRYPYEIEDLKKKIAILDDALNTKRKLFQAKQDVFQLLSSVDSLSESKKMVNLDVFIEKEQTQIKEKYGNREKIDENVLGDYLVSFEKLNISLPPIIEDKFYEEFDKEDLYNSLKTTFEDLSEKEKSACFVASSFLRECLILLMEKHSETELNINDVINKLILDNRIHLFNDAFTTLDYYINAKIRVKYFGIIKMKTFETFMISLVEVIQILKDLRLRLSKTFYGYYVDRDKAIVNLYLKNIIQLNKKSAYIARFMPNVPLYYSPVSIIRQLDIMNNNELVERTTDTIFLLKDMVNIKTSDNKTLVVKYEKDKVVKEDCVIVRSLKEKSRCCYYEDMIYNKEDGGLYE